MPEHATRGWLPVDIALDPQPALITEAPIRWMEFGSAPLAEPFFEQTAGKLRNAARPAREIETNSTTLLRMAERLPAVRPAGFIFHISHCGSTLIANGLKTAERVVVASEPTPVAKLARRYADVPGTYLNRRWEERRRNLLDAWFRLCAHYRTGESEALVIKFASFNTMGMRFVRTHWPDTPCVVLVRDPSEVMVTALAEPGWMLWKERHSALAFEIFDLPGAASALADMDGEEYCARILGRLFDSARAAVDANCKVIDYEDLNPKRLREMAEFFGIELPGGRESMDRVFSVSAKDPTATLRFQNDRARKRGLVTGAINQAVRKWALPGYSDLRASGFW